MLQIPTMSYDYQSNILFSYIVIGKYSMSTYQHTIIVLTVIRFHILNKGTQKLTHREEHIFFFQRRSMQVNVLNAPYTFIIYDGAGSRCLGRLRVIFLIMYGKIYVCYLGVDS